MATAVLIVIVYTTRSHIALSARFQLAARLGSSDGGFQILVDKEDLEALARFSPRQIAGYLDSSRTTFRAIACQVLGRQLDKQGDGDWTGIAPTLANMALNDSEPMLRQRASRLIDRLPSIPIDDGRQILGYVTRQPDNPMAPHLAAVVVAQCTDIIEETRTRLLVRNATDANQDELILTLAELLPNDEALSAPLRDAIRHADGRTPRIVGAVRKLADGSPEILAELLHGTESERRIAVGALSGPSNWPSKTQLPREMTHKWDSLNSQVLERATEVAEELFSSGDATNRTLAINFFQWRPRGGHILVEHLDDLRSDQQRVEILVCLSRIAWTAYYANDGAFQFTKEEGDRLVALLDDQDDRVRAEVAQVLNPGIPPAPRPGGAFVPGTGPLDPANAHVFRRLLDSQTGELHWLAMNYFSRVTPFEESDVDRMLRAVRRDAETLKASGSSGKGTAQARVTFNALCERYPNHAGVVACALDMIAKPNVDTDAALYLLGLPAHRDQAMQRLQECFQSTTTNTGLSLEWAILGKAKKQPDIVNPTLLQEIASRVLSASGFNDTWPNTTYEEISSLFEPDAMKSIERTALRQRLATIIDGSPQSNSSGRITQRIRSTPGFAEEAVAIAEQAVASKDIDRRAAGLAFIGEANIGDDELDLGNLTRAAIDCLEHNTTKVVVAAADAMGSLHVKDPLVIRKLHELLDREHPEAVRASALRNLILLQPNEPETHRLIDSLANDPNFAVRSEAQRALKARESGPVD
jgi:hypothetical protein